jgi:hypothetical protein
MFIRPVGVCVLPALGWRLVRAGVSVRTVLLGGLALLPGALGVTVWGTRNYRLFGEFVWFTTNLGHHNAYDFDIPADYAFAKLRAEGLNEAQINRELLRWELDGIRNNPVGALWLWCRRAADLFSLHPAWELEKVTWKWILNPRKSLTARLYRAWYAHYLATYTLAACGAAVLLLRRRRLGGLWSLLLCYVAIHAAFSRGDIRLAAPIYPILCVLAGGLWAALVEYGRTRLAPSGRQA